MNLEIVEFYPIEIDQAKGNLNGTLHIFLSDIGVDLRGILVSKRKEYWNFTLPFRKTFTSDTEVTRYPTFSFRDREKTNQLLQLIRQEGRKFVERRLTDTENPLIFPEKNPQPPKQVTPTKDRDNPTVAKKTASNANATPPREKPAIASIKWEDPPPRKAYTKDGAYARDVRRSYIGGK